MAAVRLIWMGQPGSRLTQERNRLTGCLRAKGLENSFVECLDKLVRRHIFFSSSTRYGGHYLDGALVDDERCRPFRTTNHFTVYRDSNPTRLDI